MLHACTGCWSNKTIEGRRKPPSTDVITICRAILPQVLVGPTPYLTSCLRARTSCSPRMVPPHPGHRVHRAWSIRPGPFLLFTLDPGHPCEVSSLTNCSFLVTGRLIRRTIVGRVIIHLFARLYSTAQYGSFSLSTSAFSLTAVTGVHARAVFVIGDGYRFRTHSESNRTRTCL